MDMDHKLPCINQLSSLEANSWRTKFNLILKQSNLNLLLEEQTGNSYKHKNPMFFYICIFV